MGFYTRAEVVHRSGLTADTLRYYERVDLIPPVERDTAGRRRYTELDLKWLGLVNCLRESGMPVAEIHRFTQLFRDDTATADDRLALLKAHEERLQQRLERLHNHLGQIRGKIAQYASGTTWLPSDAQTRHQSGSA